jgi:hypothetical protein
LLWVLSSITANTLPPSLLGYQPQLIPKIKRRHKLKILPNSGLVDASLNSSRGGGGGSGFDRGCADGRAAEDSSLSDASGGYAAGTNLSGSSGSMFHKAKSIDKMSIFWTIF